MASFAEAPRPLASPPRPLASAPADGDDDAPSSPTSPWSSTRAASGGSWESASAASADSEEEDDADSSRPMIAPGLSLRTSPDASAGGGALSGCRRVVPLPGVPRPRVPRVPPPARARRAPVRRALRCRLRRLHARACGPRASAPRREPPRGLARGPTRAPWGPGRRPRPRAMRRLRRAMPVRRDPPPPKSAEVRRSPPKSAEVSLLRRLFGSSVAPSDPRRRESRASARRLGVARVGRGARFPPRATPPRDPRAPRGRGVQVRAAR